MSQPASQPASPFVRVCVCVCVCRTVSERPLLEVLALGPVARLVPHVDGEVVGRVGVQPDDEPLARLTVNRVAPRTLVVHAQPRLPVRQLPRKHVTMGDATGNNGPPHCLCNSTSQCLHASLQPPPLHNWSVSGGVHPAHMSKLGPRWRLHWASSQAPVEFVRGATKGRNVPDVVFPRGSS